MALPLVDVETVPFNAKPLEISQDRVKRARIARRGLRNANAVGGHCVGCTDDPSSGTVHVLGSVLAQLGQGLPLDGGLDPNSVRYRKIAGRGSRNLLFVIDASGSMLSSERLALVKGYVVSQLQDAYVKRTRVAIVSYGGTRARLLLPFTSSAEMAARRIDHMKGGGGTPLIGALAIATRLVERLDGEPVELVLISDGRYNRGGRTSAVRQIKAFGYYCKCREIPVHLVDASTGTKTALKRTAYLAGLLQADRWTLEELRIDR